MHRDVKPHNVMIDHEQRKVFSLRQILIAMSSNIQYSYDSLTGVLLSSTIKALSTTSGSRLAISKVPNFWLTSKSMITLLTCGH
jgi:serine/threonine protein kinase